VFLREVSHLKLGLFENSTWCFKHPIECSILWHLCPFSFLSANNTLLSLFVSVCFVFVGGLIVVLNGCFLHGVFLLSFWCAHVGSVLSSTYCCLRTSAVLMVLSSTEGTTVPWRQPYNSIYIVPLLCFGYSTHGDVKYWECHSTRYLGGFRTTVLLLFYSSIQHCHGALYSTCSILLLLSFPCILKEASFLLSC
jgi:hypothetical protein